MRRLVFATQKLDPGDPVLAATVPMVRALAARVDELVVLCDTAVPSVVPANVTVREFGAPTQAQRGARFVAALARALRPRPALHHRSRLATKQEPANDPMVLPRTGEGPGRQAS